MEEIHADLTNTYFQSKSELSSKKKLIFSEAESWKGKARRLKELEALKSIDVDVSEEELKRVIRATYIKKYPPTIELHGFKFRLELDEN